MKYLYVLLLVLISGLSTAQTFGTCPLDSGNVWVYDFIGSYQYWNLLDSTLTYNDTLSCQILHGNLLGQISEVKVRLREDNYYVQRMPDTYNAPNHERIYYKIGAKIGDSWMQPDPDASKLASGVYIYQLRVNDYVSSKKMLLLK